MPAPLLQEVETIKNTVGLLASGKTQIEIAKDKGVSEATISRFKDKHRIEIEAQAEKYLTALPNIIDQNIFEIAESKKLAKELIYLLQEENQIIETKEGKAVELFPTQRVNAIQKLLERTDKKTTDMLRSIGILSSHSPAIIFQQMNIYTDNRSVVSPEVMGLLQGRIEDITSDAEVEGEVAIEG